jgi:hypothetical protein
VTHRGSVVSAALLGAVVGMFWLFAIDAGLNGAHWPPNRRTWPAHVTCPFIPFVGVSTVANVLVPVLNGLLYGVVIWCCVRILRRPHSS